MQKTIQKDSKIAVLCGGMSSEREISLRSGKNCLSALHRLGYNNAEIVDVSENFMNDIKGFEFAYNTLHGKYGEDGCIQGILEILKIPYTGCGVMASAICMNKEYTKEDTQPLIMFSDEATGTNYQETDKIDEVGIKIIEWKPSEPLKGNIK